MNTKPTSLSLVVLLVTGSLGSLAAAQEAPQAGGAAGLRLPDPASIPATEPPPAGQRAGQEQPAPTAAKEAPSTAAPAPANELNFDLLDTNPKQAAATSAAQASKASDVERKARRRRAMLKTHQALGFVTLGVMAATLVIGQLNYQDKYGGGDDNGQFYNAHLGLSIATTGLFATIGMLGLLAPNPYPKPLRFDTALVHKVSMALATAGMVAQLILGPVTASREGHLDQRPLALAHLVTGYATFGFMSAGVIAYVF